MSRKHFDENSDAASVGPGGADRSLLCSSPGCGRKWTCDFGRRLCSDCDARRHGSHATKPPQQRIEGMRPLREAVRPYAEAPEHDEAEF